MSLASPVARAVCLCAFISACTRHAMVSRPVPDAGPAEAGAVLALDADTDGGADAGWDLAPELAGPEVVDAPPDLGATEVDTREAGAEAPVDARADLAREAAVDLPGDGTATDVAADLGGRDTGGDLGGDATSRETGSAAPVLPSPRHEPAVFSDGQSVYVAGGLDDKGTVLSQIVRFTPATGTVTVLPEVLPVPTYAAGVAWTGHEAYLIGGIGTGGALRQIIRYVPATGTTSLMSAQLPLNAYNVSAVWTGSTIYALGGQSAGVHLPQIWQYDPATDTLTALPVGLPVGIEAPGVLWDGNSIWLLGGKIDQAGTSGIATNAIQTFSPATGQASLAGTLPYAVWDMPAFDDGKVVYLPGGSLTSTTGTSSILRFDPATQITAVLAFSLPMRLAGRVGAWVASAGAGYICGGADPVTGKPSDKIFKALP